jgi:hypothetical protein
MRRGGAREGRLQRRPPPLEAAGGCGGWRVWRLEGVAAGGCGGWRLDSGLEGVAARTERGDIDFEAVRIESVGAVVLGDELVDPIWVLRPLPVRGDEAPDASLEVGRDGEWGPIEGGSGGVPWGPMRVCGPMGPDLCLPSEHVRRGGVGSR